MLERGFNRLRRRFRYEEKIYDILSPHVNGGKVLSIGCGQGIVEQQLQARKGLDMQGVEVTKYKNHKIKTTHYDGSRIPFPDNSFDTSMLIYMLHHHTDIRQVLKEAVRVTKRSIIILDHTYTNQMAKAVLKGYDYLANIPYNMPVPLNFLRPMEWKSLFKSIDLEIEESRIPTKLNVFFRLKIR